MRGAGECWLVPNMYVYFIYTHTYICNFIHIFVFNHCLCMFKTGQASVRALRCVQLPWLLAAPVAQLLQVFVASLVRSGGAWTQSTPRTDFALRYQETRIHWLFESLNHIKSVGCFWSLRTFAWQACGHFHLLAVAASYAPHYMLYMLNLSMVWGSWFWLLARLPKWTAMRCWAATSEAAEMWGGVKWLALVVGRCVPFSQRRRYS